MNSWTVKKLGTIVTHKKGYAFKSDWFQETGIPVIKVTNFSESSVDKHSIVFVNEMIAEQKKEYKLYTNDVVIQTVGSWPNNPQSVVGKVIKIPKDLNNSLLNQNAVILRPNNYQRDDPKLYEGYLFYLLKDRSFKGYIINTAQGAANQASITLDSIFRYEFHMPCYKTQKKIAAILSAYDDLIENNKRRIAILEKMVEEIYREWFVRMRFPGHEKVKFKKGIPGNWKYEKLDDLCSIIKRGVSPSYDDNSKNLVINQRCIRDGGIDLCIARGHNTKVPKEKYIQYGDALINSTGVGTLGRMSIVYNEPDKLTVDSHITICRADTARIKLHYLSHSVKRYQEYFEYMATGATGQVELNRSLIAGTRILLPDTELQAMFSEIASPIWKMRNTLIASLKGLICCRDLLLPRLISGKLAVDTLNIQFPPSMQPLKDTAHA